MDTAKAVTDERPTSTGRSAYSPKLLARKAREKAGSLPTQAPLEASFPAPAPLGLEPAKRQVSGACGAEVMPCDQQPTSLPGQPSASGALMPTISARAQRLRGRDVGAQRLRPGKISPNPQTVIRTIFDLVAEREELSRNELLDLMASASFQHPKAKPQDRGWCQGYVSGAIRGGFLTAAFAVPAQDGGHPAPGEV